MGELAPLGVRLKLDIVEEADWARVDRAGEWQISTNTSPWNFTPALGPEAVAGPMTRASVNPQSRLKHEDAKIDDYFARIAAAGPDLEQRIKLWRELERYLVLDQALAPPTFIRLTSYAYRTYVKGVYVQKQGIGNNLDRATVWLDK